MRFAHQLIFIATACLTFAGCARKEAFDIVVRNETRGAITVALTKDGPPFEALWAGPEDLAIASPRADEQHGFAVLEPGQEADVSLEGRFQSGVRGYVRAYRGDLLISDMTAIGPASPNRIDLPLRPGINRIVVGEENGRLVHKRGATPVAPRAANPTTTSTTLTAPPL